MAIYFKGGSSPDVTNIKELIEKGFTEFCGMSYQFAETFINAECTEVECKPARRSFSALVEICQTYFPEITQEDVAKVLVELIQGKRDSFLCCGFCGNINKVVFCRQSSEFIEPGISSWGMTNASSREGEDGISFNQILKLAGYENV